MPAPATIRIEPRDALGLALEDFINRTLLRQNRRPGGDDDEAGRCGGCGSRNMMVASDGAHAVCLDCQRLQEPEARDWPEAKMCDNCAFRAGSPERADPWRWMQVQETLEDGEGPFYCHKGLVMTLRDDGQSATFRPPDPATDRVKVCAGWIASKIARLRRAEDARKGVPGP